MCEVSPGVGWQDFRGWQILDGARVGLLYFSRGGLYHFFVMLTEWWKIMLDKMRRGKIKEGESYIFVIKSGDEIF